MPHSYDVSSPTHMRSHDTLSNVFSAEPRSDVACITATWCTWGFARTTTVFIEATNHWLDHKRPRLQGEKNKRKQQHRHKVAMAQITGDIKHLCRSLVKVRDRWTEARCWSYNGCRPHRHCLGSAAELMEMTPGGTWINQTTDKAPDDVPPTHTLLFWPIKPSDHPLRESAIMEPDLLGIYELIKARLGDLWWQQSETDCWSFFICEHVGGVWLRCTVCKSFTSYKGNQCELFMRCWAGRRWRGKWFLFTVYRQNFNS